MMLSPRVEDGLRAFFSDMLAFDRFDTLDIDTTLYPKFTKNVEDEAREQTLRTIADHLLEQDVDYRDLFDSRKIEVRRGLVHFFVHVSVQSFTIQKK